MNKWFHKFFIHSWRPKETPNASGLEATHSAVNCQAINASSGRADASRRVAEFAASAPNCICELHTSSPHSPQPVTNDETVTRFLFSPIHVSKDGKTVKPAAFSHVVAKGCSVQRESLATLAELEVWLSGYQQYNSAHQWVGTLPGNCGALRLVQLDGKAQRALAVYDTAEPANQAHAEIFQTEYVIEESDRAEVRAALFKIFNNGILIAPESYRGGELLNRILKAA